MCLREQRATEIKYVILESKIKSDSGLATHFEASGDKA